MVNANGLIITIYFFEFDKRIIRIVSSYTVMYHDCLHNAPCYNDNPFFNNFYVGYATWWYFFWAY